MVKRILYPADLRPLKGDHIISDRTAFPQPVPVSIVIRHPADFTLFPEIHRFLRAAELFRSAVLYLYKYQIPVVIPDQVNLSLSAAEIALHNAHSVGGKVFRCQRFFSRSRFPVVQKTTS
jgi:hypothetical protein